MSRERRRVSYSGHVQGVGFRFTTERLARRFDVAGTVRNLDDGRVEVLVEGETPEVKSFLDAIRQALGKHIRDAREEDEPPGDPPLTGFAIGF